MKIREMIAILLGDGWFLRNQKGIIVYKHPTKKGRVTVAGALRDDVHPKTLKIIFIEAGWERQAYPVLGCHRKRGQKLLGIPSGRAWMYCCGTHPGNHPQKAFKGA
jgi:predicted RNA binding protein YcfA (HicA-like mRNA interferase family)